MLGAGSCYCWSLTCLAMQGHDVSETMGAGVIVYVDFVDSVTDFLLVGGQHSGIPSTKPAEMYLVHTWECVF